MTGQENFRAFRPDAQTSELQLPRSEVGQRASQLIRDFKQAVKRIPEFTQKLQDLYFAEVPRDEYSMWKDDNTFRNPIDFTIDNYKYSVQYRAMAEEEELLVKKFPLTPEDHDWWLEFVKVTSSAFVNSENYQFNSGAIQHAKLYKDRKGYNPINTPTAIQRVQDFLTTNFGKS